jgi:hypothetical protein
MTRLLESGTEADKLVFTVQLSPYIHFTVVQYIVKKKLSFFQSPAGMSVINLSRVGINLIFPGQGEFGLVTSRLGMGKSITFFYSVGYRILHPAATSIGVQGTVA